MALLARKTVDGLRHGIHRSKRKGISTEFDHHKLYQPGDSLRHLDWKASARHGRWYVRRYIEDIALTLWLVADRSASMRADAGSPAKYLHAARLAASLAYLGMGQGDAVGLALANAKGVLWTPPRAAEAHLVALLQALASEEPTGADGVEACLAALLARLNRRGAVVLISDLVFPPEPAQALLASLQAQGQEVLICRVCEPREAEFPFRRWMLFVDRENPGRRQRVDAVALRRLYLEEYRAVQSEWDIWARKHDIHILRVDTGQSLERPLAEYLLWRREAAKNA